MLSIILRCFRFKEIKVSSQNLQVVIIIYFAWMVDGRMFYLCLC